MIKIYHNPRCSKSRAGLNYIQEHGIECTVVEYLKEQLSAKEIKSLIQKTGLPVMKLIRTHEDYYKKNLKGKTFSDEEWYSIIAENPKLLHRPIIVNGEKAVFAQPPENIKQVL